MTSLKKDDGQREFRIGQEIDAPLLANMVEGGRTPILNAKRLAEIGYDIAIYPAVGFLAVAAATFSCGRFGAHASFPLAEEMAAA